MKPTEKLMLQTIVFLAAIHMMGIAPIIAGELSIYGKSGYFSLTETNDGQRYVSEGGFIYGAGASYSLEFARYFTAQGTLEAFYGKVDYEGVKLSDQSHMNSDTEYTGTKQEVALGARIPFGSFSIGPVAGFGHKWFNRSRSDELWSYIFAKGGAYAEYKGDGFTISVEGGAMKQLDTSVNIDWTYLGVGKLTCKPKGKINPYTEFKIKKGSWLAAFFYEEANWGRSDNVPISMTQTNQSGAVIVNGQAFQPDTRSSMVGLKISYNF